MGPRKGIPCPAERVGAVEHSVVEIRAKIREPATVDQNSPFVQLCLSPVPMSRTLNKAGNTPERWRAPPSQGILWRAPYSVRRSRGLVIPVSCRPQSDESWLRQCCPPARRFDQEQDCRGGYGYRSSHLMRQLARRFPHTFGRWSVGPLRMQSLRDLKRRAPFPHSSSSVYACSNCANALPAACLTPSGDPNLDSNRPSMHIFLPKLHGPLRIGRFKRLCPLEQFDRRLTFDQRHKICGVP